jgi:tRNA dimethylallyltransferase
MTSAHKLKATPYKLLIIVGPTSSGKSELAVKLAKRFNGEIISADSRQIYKGMDLGTGKVTGKWFPLSSHPERVPPKAGRVEGSLESGSFGLPLSGHSDYVYIYKSIPHHLIDFVKPIRQYSVALFKNRAKKIISNISARGKLPILCGGTGHWIDAVVYDQNLPEVKPHPKLRKELELESAERLFKRIKKLDPQRAKTIDPHNKRRLIRALEIILTTGKPVPPLQIKDKRLQIKEVYWLGINIPQARLYQKIDKRLQERLKAGMIEEVQNLHSPPFKAGVRGGYGLSYKRLESFGLEYKYIAQFLQNKISYNDMLTQLSFAIKHYSKRQLTWWKRNKNIKWISNPSKPPIAEIKKWINR